MRPASRVLAALSILLLPACIEAQVTSSGTLTATPSPAFVQQNVLLNAKFTPAAPPVGSAGAPTGTVTFKNGSATLGTGRLVLDASATLAQGTTSLTAALPVGAVSTVDLNKDGRPDLLFFDGQARMHVVLAATVAGSFQTDLVTTPEPNCSFISSFVVGDVNRDGFPDVLLNCQTTGGPLTDLLVSKGNGAFTAATAIPGVYGLQLGLGDMDKDGKVDLVVGGSISPAGCSTCNFGFMVFKGDGTGGFTLAVTTQTTTFPGSEMMVADVNGDGYPDIVELNNASQNTNSIDVYGNKSGTQFGSQSGAVYVPSSSIPLANFPSYFFGLYTGDFNGDGLPDFGVNGEQAAIVTALNTSTLATISFATARTIVLSSPPSSVSVGDFNGDGNSDLLLVYGNTGATVYDSDGAGGFGTNYSGLVIVNGSTSTAVAVDENADGDADVVVFAPGGSTATVTFNAISYITTGSAIAKLTTSFAQSGVASLTAVWAGNIPIQGSTASASLTINPLPTTTSLNTSGTPTEYGQTVTLTASVSPGAAGGTPTGSITFMSDTAVLGVVTMTGGSAQFSTSTLSAGGHGLTAVYSGDSTFATSTSSNVNQVVTQAAVSVSWTPSPSTIPYGTPLGAGQLNATASSKYVTSVPGTFSYTPVAGTVLPAGSQQLSVTFTPTNSFNFKGATGTVSIIVSKATPTINWSAPAPIVYGTALSVTQLNATAAGISGSLPGTFVYTPAAGTVLGAGNNQALSVIFTPTDTANYATATGGATINVTQARPSVNWSTPAPITYGTALSGTQLNATATGISGSLPGTFVYTPAAGTVLSTGNQQSLSVSFTPTDTTNYTTATGGTAINVTQATPTINWSTPAPIVIGTPLSATQLNATATGISGNIPGVFVYTPAAGTQLSVGNNQGLSVTFTPTDATNYATATGSTTINVLALAVASLLPNTSNLGDPAKTVTVTGTGFLSDSVVRVNGTSITTTYVSATSLTAVIPASYFQTVQILSITVFDPTQGQTSNATSLPVVAVPPAVIFSGPGTTQPATQPTLTFTLTNPYPAVLTGTLTLAFAGSGGVNDPAVQFAAGGRTMNFTIPANSTVTPVIQFQSGTVAGTITVTLALFAASQNVTPGSVQPIVITIPPAAPSLTSATLSRTGNVLTVTVQGFSNTREVSQAVFHFTAASGSSISDPDITLPATTLFSTWFGDVASQVYGSTFTYIQTFNLSRDANTVGNVTVKLTNSAGTSTTATAQ